MGKKSKKFFWVVAGFWRRFWGVATAFPERLGRFGVWKTPRGVQNAPFSRDYGPDFPRQWATTAPVLPRKTRVLATMLWNGVDGIRGFPRSLAWDLHAGEGFNAAGHGRGRSPAREIARHRRVNSGRRGKAGGTRLRPPGQRADYAVAGGGRRTAQRMQETGQAPGRMRADIGGCHPDRSGGVSPWAGTPKN